MTKLTLVTALSVALVVASPADAIRWRHDRDGSANIAAAEDYPAVGLLMGQVGATLIAPEWALTAAHAVENVDPFSRWRVEFLGVTYPIDKIFVHPRRIQGAVDSDFDIALVRLRRPVQGVNPMPLYEGSDEVGQIGILVGRGVAGPANAAGQRDGVLRRAENRIAAAFEHSLADVFDAPPAALDLEGIAGAGDSGGPLLIRREGQLYIAGVGSFGSASDEASAGRYGELSGYARISSHRQWIAETIAADGPSTMRVWSDFARVRSARDWPRSVQGRVARDFLAGLNADDAAALTRFFETYGSTESPRTSRERAEAWRADFSEAGRLRAHAYRVSGDSIAASAFSASTNIWYGFLFDVSPETGRLTGIQTGQLPPQD